MQQWLREALRAARVVVGDDPGAFGELRSHAMRQLPVTVIDLRGLTTSLVWDWLTKRQIPAVLVTDNRELHGCMVARRGCAIIFVSADDSDNERAFTFAHELAHFIVEVLVPRQRALATFGEPIRPVLDGERPPTPAERFGALLDRVPLGSHVHFMSRDTRGCISSWEVEDAEQRADRLALELMVPARVALYAIRESVPDLEGLDSCARAAQTLAVRFRLPQRAASAYAEVLLGARTRRGSTLDLFGGR
jgi:IrrE N-terminal-like domain